ncbi:MAG: shikimate kinase, partial [Anaerolineaceae bacterium]
MTARRIFLIGLSGSGKSTVGRVLGERLGWEFADSDRELESARGRGVPEIFRDEGEEAFRGYEAAALEQLAMREPIVVATGGGAPTNERSRRAMGSGFVVWLVASPERAGSDPLSPARRPPRADRASRPGAARPARGAPVRR